MSLPVTPTRPIKSLHDLDINDTSGVDHPASGIEGWLVQKAADVDALAAVLKAEDERIRKSKKLFNALKGPLDDAPDDVKAAAEKLQDYLNEAGFGDEDEAKDADDSDDDSDDDDSKKYTNTSLEKNPAEEQTRASGQAAGPGESSAESGVTSPKDDESDDASEDDEDAEAPSPNRKHVLEMLVAALKRVFGVGSPDPDDEPSEAEKSAKALKAAWPAFSEAVGKIVASSADMKVKKAMLAETLNALDVTIDKSLR